MTDEKNQDFGQILEFRYISLVFKRGKAEFLVKDLIDELEKAIDNYNRLKAEEDIAKNEVNKYYGKQMLI